MIFIPDVNVIHNGRFFHCGVEVEISDNEANDLSEFGVIKQKKNNMDSEKKSSVEKSKSATTTKRRVNKKS